MSAKSLSTKLNLFYQPFSSNTLSSHLIHSFLPRTTIFQIRYTKLSTNRVFLRKLMFEFEQQLGKISLTTAVVAVKDEPVELWEYAAYGDIRTHPGYIVRQITSLHEDYKNMRQKPHFPAEKLSPSRRKKQTSPAAWIFCSTTQSSPYRLLPSSQ